MNNPKPFAKTYLSLVISSDKNSSSEIEDLLSLSSKFVTQTISMDDVSNYNPSVEPDIIIADATKLNESQMGILELIRQNFPSRPIILISETLDDSQIRQLLKLKFQDWLKKPLDKKLFHSTLYSNLQLANSSTSKVHAVISPIGGVGVTSIAISSADFLVQKTAKLNSSIALFDLDFSTGNCGYSLNLQNTYNLETIVNSPTRIDAEFIDIIKHKHESGFNLYSFKRPEIITKSTGSELVLRMLGTVSIQHDHTILDIPYYETPWKDEVLSAVNTITIVSGITLPAIKHARELAGRINQIRSDNLPIQVIFNRYQKKLFGHKYKFKNAGEIFKKFKLTSFPEDTILMEEAVNRGMLPSEINKNSKFLKELGKYIDAYMLVEPKR